MPEQIENRMVVDSQWEPHFGSVLARCKECGCELHEDDDCYDFGGDIVCESCVEDYVKMNYKRALRGGRF